MRSIRLVHSCGNGESQACLLTASNMVRGFPEDGDNNQSVCKMLQGFIPITNDRIPEDVLSTLYSNYIFEINGTYTDDPDIMEKRADKLLSLFIECYNRFGFYESSIVDMEFTHKNIGTPLFRSALQDIKTKYDNAIICKKSKHYSNFGSCIADCFMMMPILCAIEREMVAVTSRVMVVYETCAKCIEELCKIGDKRPVEKVMSEEQLREKLGAL